MKKNDADIILEDWKKSEEIFCYRMLDRLKSDIDYFFGYGNKNEEFLWARDFEAQIYLMKELYNHLCATAKTPTYITMKDIINYENKFKEK